MVAFSVQQNGSCAQKKGRNSSCLAVDAKVIDVGACINSRVRSFLKKISPCVCCSCSRLGKVIVFKMSADKNDGRSTKPIVFCTEGLQQQRRVALALLDRGREWGASLHPKIDLSKNDLSKNRRCAFSNECFPCACPESVLGE